jgi:hypothetical protein
VKDRSLKDEMRAAVRGDLERSGVNLRPTLAVPAEEEPPSAPVEEASPASEHAGEEPVPAPIVPAPDPLEGSEELEEPQEPQESHEPQEPEPAPEHEQRRGFLSRIFRRR